MSSNITATVVQDSINIQGCRLTTLELVFPRIILAEVNTHCMLARNTASSRAIPVERMIQTIKDQPFIPKKWGMNQPGMQARTYLPSELVSHAEDIWLNQRDDAIDAVNLLQKNFQIHKQTTNRLLEPWMMVKSAVSATEWDNFLIQRAHQDAQPEFEELAYAILDALNNSVPQSLAFNQWHVPYFEHIDEQAIARHPFVTSFPVAEREKRKVLGLLYASAACCARVSYNRPLEFDFDKDITLCNRLFTSDPRHLSPAEHVAVNMGDTRFHAKFKGFKQLRKFFEARVVTDSRLAKYSYNIGDKNKAPTLQPSELGKLKSFEV